MHHKDWFAIRYLKLGRQSVTMLLMRLAKGVRPLLDKIMAQTMSKDVKKH